MAHFPKMGKKPQGNFIYSLSGMIKLLGGDIAKFKHVARAQDFRGLEFGSPCYFKIHKMVLIIFFNGFQNLKDSKWWIKLLEVWSQLVIMDSTFLRRFIEQWGPMIMFIGFWLILWMSIAVSFLICLWSGGCNNVIKAARVGLLMRRKMISKVTEKE